MRQTILAVLSLSTIAALLTGCGGDMVLLNSKGPVAEGQSSLMMTAIYLMLLVVIPSIIMALWFGWKYRASNKDADYAPTWTDSTHTHLEEAGTMNVFFRINDTLYTAPTSERILDGVTRKSLIQLGTHLGMEFKVEPVKVETIVEAAKNGSLKEIFGAGTAAVVNQIEGFAYKDDYYQLPEIADEDSFALQLKDAMTKLQNKLAEDPFNWTVKI